MSDIVVVSANQAEAAQSLVNYMLQKIELLLKEKSFVTIGLSGK